MRVRRRTGGEVEEEHGRQTFPARALLHRAEKSEVGVGMGQQRRRSTRLLVSGSVGPISVQPVQAPMQGQQAAQRRSPYRHRRLVELSFT
jgi:hypothetical protein